MVKMSGAYGVHCYHNIFLRKIFYENIKKYNIQIWFNFDAQDDNPIDTEITDKFDWKQRWKDTQIRAQYF